MGNKLVQKLMILKEIGIYIFSYTEIVNFNNPFISKQQNNIHIFTNIIELLSLSG